MSVRILSVRTSSPARSRRMNLRTLVACRVLRGFIAGSFPRYISHLRVMSIQSFQHISYRPPDQVQLQSKRKFCSGGVWGKDLGDVGESPRNSVWYIESGLWVRISEAVIRSRTESELGFFPTYHTLHPTSERKKNTSESAFAVCGPERSNPAFKGVRVGR